MTSAGVTGIEMGSPLKRALGRVVMVVVVALLAIWLLFAIYPVIFLVMTSFKTDTEIMTAPFALPERLFTRNWTTVMEGSAVHRPIYGYIANSVAATAGTLVLLLVVAGMAGYGLARGKFPGSRALQTSFFLSLAVPGQVLIIPIYFLMGSFKLQNNLLGLILVYTTVTLPFTALMMRAYFLSFPAELEEAALIDGCTRWSGFWRVVVPMSRNAIASMAIVNVTGIWSELLFAMVLLRNIEVQTLPLAVMAYSPRQMTGELTIGAQFASMVMASVPLVIFYFLFQRRITKGMTMGSYR